MTTLPPASITSGCSYVLKPTSVRVNRRTIATPASNATTFNPSDTSHFYIGALENHVMDGQSAFLRFKLTPKTANSYLDVSGHSLIQRLNIYGSGGQLISTIDNYGSLCAALVDISYSQSDKIGLSSILGTEEVYETATSVVGGALTAIGDVTVTTTLNQANRKGKFLDATTVTAGVTGKSYTLALPLISPIFSLSEKYLPLFACNSDIKVEVVWASAVSALVGGATASYQIDVPELVYDVLSFDSDVMSLIRQTYANRDLVISAQDYRFYATTIQKDTTGIINQIIPAKLQSVRMALMRFIGATQSADSESYSTGSSANPFWGSSDYCCLNIAGQRVPNKPVYTEVAGDFSNYFSSTQNAFHAMSALEMNGSLPASYYNVYTANGKYSATANSYKNAFVFAIGLDRLHRQGQTSNSGMDLSQVTTYLEGKITTAPTQAGAATTDAVNCHIFMLHDILIVIDSTGTMTARW